MKTFFVNVFNFSYYLLSLFLVYLDELRVSANAAHTQAQSPGGQLAALSHWPAEAALFATVGESHGIPGHSDGSPSPHRPPCATKFTKESHLSV